MKENTIVHNEHDHTFYIECTAFINKVQLKQLMSFLRNLSSQSIFGFYEYGDSFRYMSQSSDGSRILKMHMSLDDERAFISLFGDYITTQRQLID